MDWILRIVALVVVLGAIFTLFSFLSTLRIARSAERLVPSSGKFAEVNGRRIHYVEAGSGPAILFVHGLGGNLYNFVHPLWPELGERYRLVAADRTGNGYSTSDAPHSGRIRDHAADMAALMDLLGIDKALIVGHSLGGPVALAMALDHPDKVAGLALLSPLTRYREEVPKGMEGLNISSRWRRGFISKTFAIPAVLRARERTLGIVFGPQEPPEDYAVAGGGMIGLRPSHFYGTSTDFRAVGQDLPDIEKRFGDIAVPVGILYGTEDRLLDYRDNGEAMVERLPGVQLELLEGVGHMPQYARPKETAAFIERMAGEAFGA